MRPEDLIIASVDDHIVEPPTMFDQPTGALFAHSRKAPDNRHSLAGVRKNVAHHSLRKCLPEILCLFDFAGIDRRRLSGPNPGFKACIACAPALWQSLI